MTNLALGLFAISLGISLVPYFLNKLSLVRSIYPFVCVYSAGFLLGVMLLDFVPHIFQACSLHCHSHSNSGPPNGLSGMIVAGLAFIALIGIDSLILKHSHCDHEHLSKCEMVHDHSNEDTKEHQNTPSHSNGCTNWHNTTKSGDTANQRSSNGFNQNSHSTSHQTNVFQSNVNLDKSDPTVQSHSMGDPTHNSHSMGDSTHNSQSMGDPTHNSQSMGDPTHNSRSMGDPTHNSHSIGDPTHNSCSMGDPTHNSHSIGDPTHNSCSMGDPTHNSHSKNISEKSFTVNFKQNPKKKKKEEQQIGTCNTKALQHSTNTAQALIYVLAISIHSLFEGFGINNNSPPTTIVGLGLHKAIESFTIGLTLMSAQKLSKASTIMLSIVFSSLTPLGIILVQKDFIPPNFRSICDGLALGSTMFIVCIEMIPPLFHSQCKYKHDVLKVALLMIGFLTTTATVMATKNIQKKKTD